MEDFWARQEYHSAVKAAIVSKYFGAWFNIVSRGRSRSLAYVDLFAGCGVYGDGAKSTPVLIMERIATNPEMARRMITMFNDVDQPSLRSLESAIASIGNISQLKHKPEFFNEEVGPRLVELLDHLGAGTPVLLFLDPFGYKGLSMQLMLPFVERWGSDCFFFFNYNRIGAALNNPSPGIEKHMVELFGSTGRVRSLRDAAKDLSSDARERVVITHLKESLRHHATQKLYLVPMRFEDEKQKRCSHHLIFASKSKKGYQVAKQIMLGSSNVIHDGVASFRLDPKQEVISSLFPPDALTDMLVAEELQAAYAGRTMTVEQIIDEHDERDNLYVKRNYQDALRLLEARGMVRADPPAERRQKRCGVVTCGPAVKVTFVGSTNGTEV